MIDDLRFDLVLFDSAVTALRGRLIRTITSWATENANEGNSIDSFKIVDFVVVSKSTGADHEGDKEQTNPLLDHVSIRRNISTYTRTMMPKTAPPERGSVAAGPCALGVM